MDFTEICEGKTCFVVPRQDESSHFPPGTAPVFFNPRMEINRDATVLTLSLVRPEHYLDAMGATGVRGLRVSVECGIPVTINDRSDEALALIRENVYRAGGGVEVVQEDANVLLSRRRFDAVDLDPFGTPAFFVDSAVRAAGRYLFVTATDTAPLCGAHQKAGMRRYFARVLNNEYHAETGLRVLMGFIARETVKYDRGISPLFCFVREHFVRVHFRVHYGAGQADRTMEHLGHVYQCPACPFRTERRGLLPEPVECPRCGAGLVPQGPLWLGRVQDHDLLDRMRTALPGMTLGSAKDLDRLLQICREEPDLSFHYDYHRLAKFEGISPPPIDQLLERLRERGYLATRAHYSGYAIKTDAPLDILLAALR
ncbi:tRNA (guanine26-N2/guanine27-N2)-dimethyltransferase [Methanolinea mesophila]|uniref:tRNA (guanine(10)-N(2))-dimethyltransferase n=1 Tax=Methanolinea mesophila TaxID=547055 RepID=UPI001AE7AAAD|nr:tRNA (guanine(10)-N(2))-dimethyltransferase [Methanolinea mesophila]MBP1927487.1 tRNA (guanine26-N2/guanine27-N2)-dimethyltransferase [Methanolinea mesophila]